MDLEAKILDLCLVMASVWKNPNLLGSSYRSNPKRVYTRAEEGAALLPRTNRLIRGTGNVEVRTSEESPTTDAVASLLVKEALLEPPAWSYQGTDASIKESRLPLETKLDEVLLAFEANDNLLIRLYDAFGFKHYEPEELHRRAKDTEARADRRTMYVIQLCSILGRALVAAGFDPKKKGAFSKWNEVAATAARLLQELAERANYNYRAIACLNSPLIDQEEDEEIAALRINGQNIFVRIAGASDTVLTELIRQDPNAPVGLTNTVVVFDFAVSVNAPVDDYLRWYPVAALIAERTADILRLICSDDLGILALEIIETEWATPAIRKTYETSYQAHLAPYQPKRFRFGPTHQTILDASNIQTLRELLPSHVCDKFNIRGLSTALRRFRAIFDRYDPSDPERLLEVAIALEAILLNDSGENKQELGYRLRLRAVRFLENTLDERISLFDILRDLYTFRSRIAHGETLDEMKTKDQVKLRRVIEAGPSILRRVLLKVMESDELRGLSQKELGVWWRKLELQ